MACATAAATYVRDARKYVAHADRMKHNVGDVVATWRTIAANLNAIKVA
jgi:ribosomal protein S17